MNDAVSGLEGLVVTETALSDVDGHAGRLVLAGYPVEALTDPPSLTRVTLLLWGNPTPASEDQQQLSGALGAARVRAFERLNRVALERNDGMDALRAAIAATDLDGAADPKAALSGAMAVNAAAWMRLLRGETPIAPDPRASHVADLLNMAGLTASPERVRALETYLVTIADHGMNASTFAARVVASTGSDLVSAVTAALGALKGPLHGGAPGPVLDMLDAIGRPERARAWLEGELSARRRIMGMGHRVYRVRDPRAFVLTRALGRLEDSPEIRQRLELARSVESEAETLLAERHPDRALKANVEFYTAILLDALGFDRRAFTPLFATGRVIGWCAHYDEQRRTGRLIRPASRYVGPRYAE